MEKFLHYAGRFLDLLSGERKGLPVPLPIETEEILETCGVNTREKRLEWLKEVMLLSLLYEKRLFYQLKGDELVPFELTGDLLKQANKFHKQMEGAVIEQRMGLRHILRPSQLIRFIYDLSDDLVASWEKELGSLSPVKIRKLVSLGFVLSLNFEELELRNDGGEILLRQS